MKLKNKKGSEMTIGTIVIIVLALIVLVVLVLGFTGGWGNLWGRITSFFGGPNIDSVVQACEMACTTKAKYDYCERVRTVKADSEVFDVDEKNKMLIQTGGSVVKSKEAKASCKTLAEFKGDLGFATCSEIAC